MKISYLIILFYIIFSFSKCEEEESPQVEEYSSEDVLILNDTNVEEEIKKSDVLLILTYAPWCPHCKKFKPTYLELSKKVKEEKLDYKISVIDGDKNSNFSQAHNIKGFPTVLLFINKGEKEYEYNGGQNVDNILKNIKKKKESPYNIFEKLEEVEKFIEENKLLLLLTEKDLKKEKIFKEIADKNNLFEFAICQSDECIGKYNNDIIFFKPHDEPFASLNNFLKEESLEFLAETFNQFLSIFSVGMGAILDESHPYYINEYNKSVLFFFRNEKDSNLDSIIKEVAKEYRKKYYFLISDVDNEVGKETSQFFYLYDNDLPAVTFYEIKGEDTFVYKMEDNITKENIIKFINDINNNKILPLLATSEPPTKDLIEKYKFKIVIGKTFDKEIINDPQNVLVLMHSTYDNKEDFEIFEKLMDKYKNNTEYDLKFVGYEINNNEIRYGGEPIKVPTVYLYLKKEKDNPSHYYGDYKFEEIDKWINAVFHPVNTFAKDKDKDDESIFVDKEENNDKDSQKKNDKKIEDL